MMKGGIFVTFEFIIGLLFVILFSIIAERMIKNPFIVAGIVATISLIILALLVDTLTPIFLIWIVIYTLASFISAYLADYFFRNHHRANFNSHDNNDGCF